MRKVFLSLLLASVAASPAIAQDKNSDDPRPTRAERQQARSDRQSAREDSRPARSERQSAPSYAPRANGPERQSAPSYAPRGNGFERQSAPQRGGDANNAARIQQRQQMRDDRAAQQQLRQGQIRDRIEQRRDLREQTRVPPVMRPRPPVVSNTPQIGTQPPVPATRRYTPSPQWNTHWRNDHRYDWRNYRNRHRSLFRLGFYYDPFGWGYQRYDIGWRLWPSYYSSNFWINDPWYYRLPYAPPGTRWVRYYDDAVLVDMWSGEVVDVIYDFFW
jgi:hypothetical protein